MNKVTESIRLNVFLEILFHFNEQTFSLYTFYSLQSPQ